MTDDQIAAHAGLHPDDVTSRLAEFEGIGRLRRDDSGRVIGIAGLSVEPTRHKITIKGITRWTWCALDAVGIISAFRTPGHLTTLVPDTDEQIVLDFTAQGPIATTAVIFVAEGYGTDSIVDTWCPTVNLFPDPAAAVEWANAHGVPGQAVPVAALAPDAARMWQPLVTTT